MLRIIAMIAAFTACTLAGFSGAAKLKNRAEGIIELLEGVLRISMLMQYHAQPLSHIISQLRQQRDSVLWKELDDALQKNQTFKDAWSEAIQLAQQQDPRFTALKQPELSAMQALSYELGRSDLITQQKHLKLAEALLQESYDTALALKNQKERIYRSLGIAAGIAGAIIIW